MNRVTTFLVSKESEVHTMDGEKGEDKPSND